MFGDTYYSLLFDSWQHLLEISKLLLQIRKTFIFLLPFRIRLDIPDRIDKAASEFGNTVLCKHKAINEKPEGLLL